MSRMIICTEQKIIEIKKNVKLEGVPEGATVKPMEIILDLTQENLKWAYDSFELDMLEEMEASTPDSIQIGENDPNDQEAAA